MSAKFESMNNGVVKAHGRKYVVCEMTFTDKPEEIKFRDEYLIQGNNIHWLKIFFNFELKENEHKALLEIEGVNSINKSGKYRLHIFLGEMFKDTVVIDVVERTLNKITDEHDQSQRQELKIVFEETGNAAIDQALRNGMRDNNRIVMMDSVSAESMGQALSRIDPGMTQMTEYQAGPITPIGPDAPVPVMSQEQLWSRYNMDRFDGP